jgi:hypothetical protein
MNIILLEDKRAPIFTSSVVKKFPRSSTIRLTPRDARTLIGLLNKKPTLSNSWLVLVDNRVSDTVIQDIVNIEHCVNVIYATELNLKHKNSLCPKKENTQIVNVINLSEEECKSYILSRIEIEIDALDKLYTQTKGYMPYVEESLTILNTIGCKVTLRDINTYIPKRSSATVNTVFYHMIGVRKAEEKVLIEFLYQFRYAIKYLKTRLFEIIEDTEKMYKDIELGILGADNISRYYSDNKFKVSEYYTSLVVLEIFPNLSIEDLIAYKYAISKVENVLELIAIL